MCRGPQQLGPRWEELARRADASTRSYENGQALFNCGDAETCFYVVRSGAVEIIDCSGDAMDVACA